MNENNQQNENITLRLSQKLDFLVSEYETSLKNNLLLKEHIESLEKTNSD